jgi:hypothetical protein
METNSHLLISGTGAFATYLESPSTSFMREIIHLLDLEFFEEPVTSKITSDEDERLITVCITNTGYAALQLWCNSSPVYFEFDLHSSKAITDENMSTITTKLDSFFEVSSAGYTVVKRSLNGLVASEAVSLDVQR